MRRDIEGGLTEWRMRGGDDVLMDAAAGQRCDDEKTILLVEDDDAHAALICRIFEDSNSGLRIHRVSGVNESLRWIEENGAPSLIIADYLLPDGNGLDLARCDDLPLIIMTAYGSERLAVHALKSGAMDYVTKRIDDLKALPFAARRVMREWQNIIQRRKAEEELRRKNSELESLLHIISHDLKSPLLSIRSLVRIIIEDDIDEAEASEYLKLIDKNAERMWNMIDMLIEVSKVGFVKIEYEDVCLKEIVEEIKDEIKGLLMRKNADVQFHSDVKSLRTSRFFLREILSNLIVNGIIYNDDARPLVEVRCEERESHYLFSVRDNGIGIPPENLSEIFEISHTLRRKRRTSDGSSAVRDDAREEARDDRSSGAGLLQCKKMVIRLGGEIWAESTLGKGSTFFFTLPKHDASNENEVKMERKCEIN